MTTTGYGIPARELSDDELERQGMHTHATRHTVFLHGTAVQFRHHTDRMLELEQEYLRRHPKRTWQGSHPDDTDDISHEELSEVDRRMRLSQAVRVFTEQIEALLFDARPEIPAEPGAAELALLARFAEDPSGRMHKLEAHQVARELSADPARVAALYRRDPPLLVTEGSERVLTNAGRSVLS